MWRFLGESVVGESHRRAGLPCQDAYGVACVRTLRGEPVLIAVCSDGAGSAEFSHLGSRATCDTMLKLVDRLLQGGGTVADIDHVCVAGWLAETRSELSTLALRNQANLRDLAATLVAAIIGEAQSAFFQIGDGACVLNAGSDGEVVFWPQNGEYANTTYFVTDETASQRLVFEAKGRVDELALFSDGIQMLALDYASKRPFTPFFEPLFRALRSASTVDELHVPFRAMLDSQRINARTDDDKSLVLAVRCAAAGDSAQPTP